MILARDTFVFVAAMIVVLTCTGYLITNAIRLYLVLAGRMGNEHDRHDRLFGAIIGMIIMTIGLVGVVKYYWL